MPLTRCSFVSPTLAFGDKRCTRPEGHDGAHVLGDLSMNPSDPDGFEVFTRAYNERLWRERVRVEEFECR